MEDFKKLFWKFIENLPTKYHFLWSCCWKPSIFLKRCTCFSGSLMKMFKAIFLWNTCDSVFRNGPSKIFGRQPLKNLSWCGLFKQTISFQVFFKGCLLQILLGLFLNILTTFFMYLRTWYFLYIPLFFEKCFTNCSFFMAIICFVVI